MSKLSHTGENVSFVVEGNPVPKGRPRLGRGGHVFTPKKTAAYEDKVGWTARIAMAHRCAYVGRVAVSISVQTSNKRGDVDNIAKSLMDGMNGVVYEDDSQVVDLHIRIERVKRKGRVSVMVTPLDGK